MHQDTHRRGIPSKAQGFGLVEVMIAMTIGLMVILGAGQLFQMARQSVSQIDELAQRQQTVRFASQLLSKDVRSAASMDVTGMSGGAGTTLTLEFEDGHYRGDYCPTGTYDDLEVIYHWNGTELEIDASCSSETRTLTDFLAGVSFRPAGDHGVEVTLRLAQVSGETSSPQVVFMTTNRTATFEARALAQAASED